MPSNTGYPAFFVGQRLTATLMTSAQPITAWKTTSTSRPSTIVNVADPDLVLPVEANALYNFSMMLQYSNAGAASGLQINITLPASATGIFVASGIQSAGANNAADQVSSFANASSQAFAGAALANLNGLWVTGSIDTAATAGSCTLTWAQNVSNATAVVLQAGCWMRLERRE